MKKIFTFFILLVTLLTMLCSCGKHEKYKTPSEKATEKQNQIMECFKNHDKETLKSFFSEYTRDNYDIDKQIDKAFDFIDGKIISYDEPFPDGICGSFEKKSYGATTSHVKTNNSIEYTIDFAGLLTDDDEKEKIGVNVIRLVNETMHDKLPKNSSEEEHKKCSIYIGRDDIY